MWHAALTPQGGGSDEADGVYVSITTCAADSTAIRTFIDKLYEDRNNRRSDSW